MPQHGPRELPVTPAATGGDASGAVGVYGAVGGEAGFRRLIADFYGRVADDALLRPLYPDADLADAQERLTLFLIQYWGGPRTYDEQRGHPRLRMRHAPFPIGLAERDAWLRNMRAALDTLELPAEADARLWSYLTVAADSMRNRSG